MLHTTVYESFIFKSAEQAESIITNFPTSQNFPLSRNSIYLKNQSHYLKISLPFSICLYYKESNLDSTKCNDKKNINYEFVPL